MDGQQLGHFVVILEFSVTAHANMSVMAQHMCRFCIAKLGIEKERKKCNSTSHVCCSCSIFIFVIVFPKTSLIFLGYHDRKHTIRDNVLRDNGLTYNEKCIMQVFWDSKLRTVSLHVQSAIV